MPDEFHDWLFLKSHVSACDRHSGARPPALNPESRGWLAFFSNNLEILGAQLRT